MTTATAPTAADLQRGRSLAEQELAQAREAHAAAAYDYAAHPTNSDKRDAVHRAKERMDELDAEILGLTAASGEAERRSKDAAHRDDTAQRLEQLADARSSLAGALADFVAYETALNSAAVARSRLSEVVQRQEQAIEEAARGRASLPSILPVRASATEHALQAVFHMSGVAGPRSAGRLEDERDDFSRRIEQQHALIDRLERELGAPAH